MNAVFGDTLYFVALLSPADQYHKIAIEWTAESERPLVTTEFILVEAAAFAAMPAGRGKFSGLVARLRANPLATIVPASAELFQAGLDLFERRPDKEWSLTDCISFAVMEAQGIRDALTADHHFEQAGFNVLLKLDDE
jgi:predicted nucleic acid-binding protein